MKKIQKEVTIKQPAIMPKITALQTRIKNVHITTAKNMSECVEILSQANQYLDALTTDREKLTKPINEALKEIRAKYKPAENALNDIISTIRGAVSQYQTTEIARKHAEEELLSKQLSSGKVDLNTAVTKLEQIKEAPGRVETASGSISFREDKVLRIIRAQDIPREYLIPDEKAILGALKTGKVIAGCELEVVMTPINRR